MLPNFTAMNSRFGNCESTSITCNCSSFPLPPNPTIRKLSYPTTHRYPVADPSRLGGQIGIGPITSPYQGNENFNTNHRHENLPAYNAPIIPFERVRSPQRQNSHSPVPPSTTVISDDDTFIIHNSPSASSFDTQRSPCSVIETPRDFERFCGILDISDQKQREDHSSYRKQCYYGSPLLNNSVSGGSFTKKSVPQYGLSNGSASVSDDSTPGNGGVAKPLKVTHATPNHGNNVHFEELIGITSYSPFAPFQPTFQRKTHNPYARRFTLAVSCFPFERQATAVTDLQTVLNALSPGKYPLAIVESTHKAVKGHQLYFAICTANYAQLSEVLEHALVLMDRHGFHFLQTSSPAPCRSQCVTFPTENVSHTSSTVLDANERKVKLLKYCESIRNLPPQQRHWRLDGLPSSIVRFQLLNSPPKTN